MHPAKNGGITLGRLGRACRTFGSGRTKTTEMLGQLELSANDAGIDVVIGSFGLRGLTATWFVGATVQVSDIRRKTIGEKEASRLLRFLVTDTEWRPVHGILVHPEPFDIGKKLICAEANCVYLCRDDIIANLRPLNSDAVRAPRANKAIKALTRKRLSKLKELRFQLEFQHLSLAD